VSGMDELYGQLYHFNNAFSPIHLQGGSHFMFPPQSQLPSHLLQRYSGLPSSSSSLPSQQGNQAQQQQQAMLFSRDQLLEQISQLQHQTSFGSRPSLSSSYLGGIYPIPSPRDMSSMMMGGGRGAVTKPSSMSSTTSSVV
jgi:hypothetical protein